MRLIQNKKVPEILNPEVESDDEAPEEVTQSSSRQKAAAVKKNIQESERLKKKRTKDKKREQNELFLKQKEEKLAELSKRKLPQDVLDAVSTTSKKKVKQNDDDDDDQSEDDSDIENDSDEENSKLSDSEILGGDFIPFNNVEKKEKQKSKKNKTGGVEVVSTTHLQSQLLTSAEKAKKFREEKLYNQNINPRQAYKQKQRLLHKRMFLKR